MSHKGPPPLWAHQERDVSRYLDNRSLFNMSDAGTGKTRVIIETIRRDPSIPVLIVAPKSILSPAWATDFAAYAPELRVDVATASNREAAFMSPSRVKITNFAAVDWLVKREWLLAQFKGGWLVIDESTAFKNPASLRTKAVIKLRERFAHCTCMSGTPNPNGAVDLWAQMFLVDGGERLGKSFYRFRNAVCSVNQTGGFAQWKQKDGVMDSIATLIDDIVIRNRREDCLDLPEHQITPLLYKPSPAIMKAYNKLRKHSLIELKETVVSAINAAALRTKLLQVAAGAVYDDNKGVLSVDTDRGELVIRLCAERPHTVVFFNWRHQRDDLLRQAQREGLTFALIDGSVNDKSRELAVRQFQQGALQVLFCHWKSAAHGLTLTRGTTNIFVSPIDDAEHFEQAMARIWRGGQTKKTETILITAEGTLEKNVYDNLMGKKNTMQDLLSLLGEGA